MLLEAHRATQLIFLNKVMQSLTAHVLQKIANPIAEIYTRPKKKRRIQ